MGLVIVTNGRYSIDDPLYQWDLNKVLEIRGLSLASVPEIHFTNSAMDRAIVRQARMDAAGVITVDVPNSLLQKPYKIKAYICIYRGASFETLYTLEIPVVARPQPNDYTISDNDHEIYSFNALENAVVNALAEMENIDGKASAAITKINAAETEAIKGITDAADKAIASMENKDVATRADIEALSKTITDLDTRKAESEHKHDATEVNGIVDLIYPIGSVYMSVNAISPETLFGGSWEQIKDTFLLSAGDTYLAGSTGGEAEHTLTVDEMPSHTHDAYNHDYAGGEPWAFMTVKRDTHARTQIATSSSSDRYTITNSESRDVDWPFFTASSGGGATHNNMPPYLAVYVWKRIA